MGTSTVDEKLSKLKTIFEKATLNLFLFVKPHPKNFI